LIAEGVGYTTGEGTCGASRSNRRLGPTQQQLISQDLSAQKLTSETIPAPKTCGPEKAGTETPDEVGNIIKIDCALSQGLLEFHIMVKEVGEKDFKSVGKCPWIGGRNSYDVLSKKNKDKKKEYVRTFWSSEDGALPGKEVTEDEYKKTHNDEKEQEDKDNAFFVDVNEYNFCLGEAKAQKTHWEMTLDLKNKMQRGKPVSWTPGKTSAVPDDNPLTPATSGRRQLQGIPQTQE
jgi:hypothetical protein